MMTRRDEIERGSRGRGRGCCGGPGCCGGHERALRFEQDTTARRRQVLEERQRDLEQELADVTSELQDLGATQP
jgi:hypothetical protein